MRSSPVSDTVSTAELERIITRVGSVQPERLDPISVRRIGSGKIFADLWGRVVPSGEYEVQWLQRCEEMQRNLDARRS